MKDTGKVLVQCDFDGTVTEEDASFIILDTFAGGKWRHLFREYQEGGMTVGQFNKKAFSMVKADRDTLLKTISGRVKTRPGFKEIVNLCRKKGFRFVIVSHGLEFYIDEILKDAGIADIEFHAAETDFQPDGLVVRYRGPDGNYLDANVKAAYTEAFLGEGYRVVYIGDGASDMPPVKKSHYVFATGSLLESCKKEKYECTPFTDFYEIIRVMESWQ